MSNVAPKHLVANGNIFLKFLLVSFIVVSFSTSLKFLEKQTCVPNASQERDPTKFK